MDLSRLNDDLNIIQTLSDTPTENAEELKAKFDESGNVIKKFINETMLREIELKLAEIEEKAILKAHPIGSLYWSDRNTNPSILFGGTWVQVKDKFILAAGDSYTAGSTGGSANAIVPYHNHTFTGTAESHTHQNGWHTTSLESAGAGLTASQYFPNRVAVDGKRNDYNGLTSSTLITPKGTIGYAGSSVTGANMPPYEVAYCWKRTA